MTSTSQRKQIDKYLKEYNKLSNKDLKSLLKLLESDHLGKDSREAKIYAIKTLLA